MMTEKSATNQSKPMFRTNRKIRVFIGRFLRTISNFGSSSEDLSENERTATRIFEKSLHKKDSDLLIAPLSETVYINNDKKQITIILQNSDLRIINGKYSYDFKIPGITSERMRRRFRLELEKRRKEMEEKITTKTESSLRDILYELSDVLEVEKKI